jgi:hypothetical protein
VDVPVATIRRLREAGGEVWPGNWDAAGVALQEGWPE